MRVRVTPRHCLRHILGQTIRSRWVRVRVRARVRVRVRVTDRNCSLHIEQVVVPDALP